MNFEGSIVFPIRDGSVLLGRKMRGVGKGFWNGFGGKMEEGESLEKATLRELKEEIGITAASQDLILAGVIDFHNIKADGSEVFFRAHIYILEEWQGKPEESEEMKTPTWFPVVDLPRSELQHADYEWMPVVFAGNIIHGDITYTSEKVAPAENIKIDITGRWKISKS